MILSMTALLVYRCCVSRSLEPSFKVDIGYVDSLFACSGDYVEQNTLHVALQQDRWPVPFDVLGQP